MANDPLRIMMIGAHPDDCEFRTAGVASLWSGRGERVCFMSVTDGGAGHHEIAGAALVQRRIAEAAAAARSIGIESVVLPIPDGGLEPTLANRLTVTRAIRKFAPDVIITCRPNDYHPDHRYTSLLVQDSAYMLMVPHVVPDTPAMRKNPAIFYWWDSFQKPLPFAAEIAIDIDSVLQKKIGMLHCHESQVYEWLPWVSREPEPVPADEPLRRRWLERWYQKHHTSSVADRCRAQLVARYGESRGRGVREAEAFELCEYGGRPTAAEMERIFGRL